MGAKRFDMGNRRDNSLYITTYVTAGFSMGQTEL